MHHVTTLVCAHGVDATCGTSVVVGLATGKGAGGNEGDAEGK
jgi:hypothetical protein